MATLTRPLELMNLPTVEYPAEVVERWKKEAEIAKLQYAAGELQTIEELAAELGLKYDGHS